MKKGLKEFTITQDTKVIEALKKINANRHGFLIVIDNQEIVLGVLTDGDIRRGFIKGFTYAESVISVYTKKAQTVQIDEPFESVVEMFKDSAIKFLPIVDDDNHLMNIITKSQMHALLLQDIQADLSYDFFSLDESVVDHEIFQRPWGFYKTTVLNEYYQAKVISVRPGGKLSLQSHNHREEHWIVVHGEGIVQLDHSEIHVSCGSNVFIPKGCKHRLTNIGKKESLIITEVQIGDYLGEDDIIRYDDIYGRVDK